MSNSSRIYILLATLAISGCSIMGEASSLAEKGGSGAFSCGQIEAVFAAYNADRQSVESYEEMARITGMSSADISTSSADTLYTKAVERANIVLLLQGCSPLQQ